MKSKTALQCLEIIQQLLTVSMGSIATSTSERYERYLNIINDATEKIGSMSEKISFEVLLIESWNTIIKDFIKFIFFDSGLQKSEVSVFLLKIAAFITQENKNFLLQMINPSIFFKASAVLGNPDAAYEYAKNIMIF